VSGCIGVWLHIYVWLYRCVAAFGVCVCVCMAAFGVCGCIWCMCVCVAVCVCGCVLLRLVSCDSHLCDLIYVILIYV